MDDDRPDEDVSEWASGFFYLLNQVLQTEEMKAAFDAFSTAAGGPGPMSPARLKKAQRAAGVLAIGWEAIGDALSSYLAEFPIPACAEDWAENYRAFSYFTSQAYSFYAMAFEDRGFEVAASAMAQANDWTQAALDLPPCVGKAMRSVGSSS